MWKRVKRIVLILVMVAIALMAAVGAYIYYQQDEIEQRLIGQLNESLETEIEVNGDIGLSVLTHFPNLALRVSNIIIKGSTGAPTDTLIEAGNLYLITSVYDLFNGNWRIQEVEIADGRLNMTRSTSGIINYQFVKPSNDSSASSSSFLLNIEEASLENIHFHLHDQLSDVILDINIYSAAFSGNFSADALSLDADINTMANEIGIKGITYVQQKAIAAEGTLQIDTEGSIYELHSNKALIADNQFSVNGSFGVFDNKTDLDLTVAGKELVITEVLKLFPGKVSSQFAEYKASGELAFETIIKGELSRDKNPQIDITYDWQDGSIHYNTLGADIEKLNVTGTYTNGKQRNLETSLIVLSKLQATQDGKTLHATATISNLNKPLLDISAYGEINLPVLQPLMNDSTHQNTLQGVVKITKASYKGTAQQLLMEDSYKPIELNFDGTFENAAYQSGGTTFGIKQGHLTISPWTIDADQLLVQYNENTLTVNGTVKYWKSYYYNLFAANAQPVQPLTVDLTIMADKFELESTEPKQGESKTPWPIAERVFDMAGSLNINIKQLKQDKLTVNNLLMDLQLGKGSVLIKKVSAQALGGNIDATGNLAIAGNGIAFKTTGKVQKLDIARTFRELDNFGQTTLTDANLKGTLTATFTSNGRFWNYTLLQDALMLTTDIALDNGQLIDFEPLQNLSSFVKIGELKDIQFSSIRNTLEIKNQTIYIPQMIIKSSALNLSIAGSHTFNNLVDYKIKVNAYDILANKIRKSNRNEQFYEVVDENSFNFFISMKGPLDNPTIAYDKQGVKERFKQQGDQLKQALKGVYDDYNADKEKRDWEVPGEDQFLEWEDKIP